MNETIMTKRQRYVLLRSQIESLICNETDPTAILANVAAAIHDAFPEQFFWVGFYLVNGGELLLGPFQGPVACMHIANGRGVCGAAWAKGETIVVDDVEQFPGHIACSSLSRSEIVVPLRHGRGIIGVLDIDSKNIAGFDDDDKDGLEAIAMYVCSVIP